MCLVYTVRGEILMQSYKPKRQISSIVKIALAYLFRRCYVRIQSLAEPFFFPLVLEEIAFPSVEFIWFMG